MKSKLVRVFLCAFALCPITLLAQDTASITGTVTDPSGAAVARFVCKTRDGPSPELERALLVGGHRGGKTPCA